MAVPATNRDCQGMQHTIIDSHCHLDRLDLERLGGTLDDVLASAEKQGVSQMLCVSITLETFPVVLELAHRYPNVYASVGVHPNEPDCHDPDVSELVRLAADPKIVAIGETGLDYFRSDGDLRVIAPDVGGGFGSKIFIYPEEVVCLWAARKVNRPVKWTAERSESFLTDAHGRDHVTHAELALDEHGKMLALRAKTVANLGAYMSTFSSCVPTYLYATLMSGQYAIPQIYCEVDAVYTNTVPVDALRGAGRPEATFVVERLVEVAARQMGIEPTDLRKRNFVTSFPHQTPVIMAYDTGDYNASLKKALELADVKGFNKRKRESARHGKLRGLGYSTYIEACGIAPSKAVGSLGCGVGLWESAEVRVNPTGTVEVLTGCHAHGQGHETTFAQVVSERLGIPIENITVVHGDTDKVQSM